MFDRGKPKEAAPSSSAMHASPDKKTTSAAQGSRMNNEQFGLLHLISLCRYDSIAGKLN